MDEEAVKVLEMLEAGKINAEEAWQLLEVMDAAPADDVSATGLTAESAGDASGAEPPLLAIARIVNEALREAFSEAERELSQLNIPEIVRQQVRVKLEVPVTRMLDQVAQTDQQAAS